MGTHRSDDGFFCLTERLASLHESDGGLLQNAADFLRRVFFDVTTKMRRRELDGEVGSADAAARRLEHLGCRLSRQISSFSAQSFDLLEKARCCSERSGEVFLFADAERLRFGNVLDAAAQFLDLIFVNLLLMQQIDAAPAYEHDALLIACLALLADTVLARLEKRVFLRQSGTRGRRRRSWRRLAAISLALVAAGGAYAFFQSTKAAVIRIATKPMTEQLILGEMLKLVIEQDSGLKVALTPGVGGGTSNIMPAMEHGDFDIYPEYTGTGWLQVLKRTDAYDESRFAELQEEYRNRYHMEWLGMTGFNDTFGIAVRRDLAERYQLRTYSDLARVADKMNFGAEYDFFEREDGFPAMCRAYGMNFASTVDIDIGLKYQALDEGKLDSMIVFTTDGRLSKVNGIVLEDDKKFFTSYECGMVVREEALSAHPELRDLLAHFDGLISEAEMAEMNDAVESGGEEPRAVARRFLEEKGVLR